MSPTLPVFVYLNLLLLSLIELILFSFILPTSKTSKKFLLHAVILIFNHIMF